MDALTSYVLSLLERTQEDFLALASAYTDAARPCEDSSQALCYMAGQTPQQFSLPPSVLFCELQSEFVGFISTVNTVYGGHVHNAFDLACMESAAKAFLSRETPLWLCGDHILADIVNSPGIFGNRFLCTKAL